MIKDSLCTAFAWYFGTLEKETVMIFREKELLLYESTKFNILSYKDLNLFWDIKSSEHEKPNYKSPIF